MKADAPLCGVCKVRHLGVIAASDEDGVAKATAGSERIRFGKSGDTPAHQEDSVTKSTVYGSGYSRVEKSDVSTPAIEQIQKIAKGLVEKDPTLSAAQSVSKAAELHPDLVQLDRRERGFGH